MDEKDRREGEIVLTGRIEIRLEGFCASDICGLADRAEDTHKAEEVQKAPVPPQAPTREYKTLAQIVERAIKENGYKDAKTAAGACGLGYSLFRKVLGGGHIPRDEQLLAYADKLGLDKERIIRLAHYERAPKEAKPYLLHLLED